MDPDQDLNQSSIQVWLKFNVCSELLMYCYCMMMMMKRSLVSHFRPFSNFRHAHKWVIKRTRVNEWLKPRCTCGVLPCSEKAANSTAVSNSHSNLERKMVKDVKENVIKIIIYIHLCIYQVFEKKTPSQYCISTVFYNCLKD